MTSEQDQVFGANPKIGKKKKLCFCRALTWHIRSQHFKQANLWLQAPYPKGRVLLRGQFSELNLSSFLERRQAIRLLTIHSSRKRSGRKRLCNDLEENTYYKTTHIYFKSPQLTWVRGVSLNEQRMWAWSNRTQLKNLKLWAWKRLSWLMCSALMTRSELTAGWGPSP